jgi:hypothetical protein
MTKVHTRVKTPVATAKAPAAAVKAAPVPTTEEPVMQVATTVALDALDTQSADTPEEDEAEADLDLLTAPSTGGEADDDGDSEEDDGDPDLSLLETPKSKKGAAADDEADDDTEEGFLEVFHENCLDCKALIPFKKKTYRDCHFSKGNTACPASQVQIVIRIPLELITRNWMRAEKEGNYAGISKLSATLATKPDWYQTRVRDALEDARKKGR